MNLRRKILFISFATIAVLMATVALIPKLRDPIQNFFYRPGHEVLATAEGDLLHDGSICKVIKYLGSEGLYVEIRKMQPDGESTMVDRVLLPDKHDGMFNFQGHITRLAIVDIDHDGKMELLAPSFDDQLVPHLNSLRYNSETGHFELFQPPLDSEDTPGK